MSLSSCFPDELPVEPYDRGDVETVSLDMGENRFSVMKYYSLSEGQVIAECDLDAFDLHLGDSILSVNPSRLMRVASGSNLSFESTKDTAGLSFKFDHSTGRDFPLRANGSLYVVDEGVDLLGFSLGFYKLSITREQDEYILEFCVLEESQPTIARVPVGSYFSMKRNETYSLPQRNEYDLLFTRYNFYFEEQKTDYLVTGVLGGDIRCIEFDDRAFENVTIDDFENNRSMLSSERDFIGYDWKEYDFDAGLYTVEEDRIFMIEDVKGFVYKLRFTSYYNDQGSSGHPSFEYKLL